jgi:hypothetical protein
MFYNDWMEVEVPCPNNLDKSSPPSQNEESQESQVLQNASVSYKDVYVDVDASKKSDRQEWGHVRYQSVYMPDQAFEITVQWIQATGAIITDLVQVFLFRYGLNKT